MKHVGGGIERLITWGGRVLGTIQGVKKGRPKGSQMLCSLKLGIGWGMEG